MTEKQFMKSINNRAIIAFKVVLILELIATIIAAYAQIVDSSSDMHIGLLNLTMALTQVGKMVVLVVGAYIPFSMCLDRKRSLLIKILGLKKYRNVLIKTVYKVATILFIYLGLIGMLRYLDPYIISQPFTIQNVVITFYSFCSVLTLLCVGLIVFWSLLILKEKLFNSSLKYEKTKVKGMALVGTIFEEILIVGLIVGFIACITILITINSDISYISHLPRDTYYIYQGILICFEMLGVYLITSYYVYNNKKNIGL